MTRAYDFKAALERVMEAAGARSQNGLAASLGLAQSSVWEAMRRESIPASWLVTLVERYGVNPAWVKTGQGPQRLSFPLEDIPLEEVIAEVVRRGVSIHSRLHPSTDSVPADRNRADCPIPEGRGYRKGRPGIAARQADISLKGEVSDYKGNFDERGAEENI